MKTITGPISTPNGQNFITAVNGGGLGGPDSGPGLVALHTDATGASSWETFTLVLQPSGQTIGAGMTFALQTSQGGYVTAVNGGGIGGPNDKTCPVHTDATNPTQWEQFTLLINDTVNPPTVQIQTRSGNYLTAVNGGGVGNSPGGVPTPMRTSDTEIQAWQLFSLPGSAQPQTGPVSAPSQAYTFALPKYTCNKMRSNNWFGTERDTDYAALSVMVNSGPPQTLTQSAGVTVDSNSTYTTNLKIPAIQIADTDFVTIQYHIINSSGTASAAVSILEQAAEKIGSAVAGVIVGIGLTATFGAALGIALGTAAVPIIGSALGALFGWLLATVWLQLNADCDGPVAAAVHVYTGAQLRVLTANAPFVSSEDNPGVASPSGCGDNSDYVVEWTVSVG